MVAFLNFGSAAEIGIIPITNGFAKLVTDSANDSTVAINSVAAVNLLATPQVTFSRYLPKVTGKTRLLDGLSLRGSPVSTLQTAVKILVDNNTTARGAINSAVSSLYNLAAQLDD